MNILLTGGTGFIGRRLLKLLDTPENEIRILSRRAHSELETVVCDFEQDIIPISTMESIDIVFHLAGLAHDLNETTSVKHLY